MKQAILLVAIVGFSLLKTFGQDSIQTKKTNPIVYVDFLIGYPFQKNSDLEFGAAINYQVKKSLLTVRSTLMVPIIGPDSYQEHAFLYGNRFIHSGHSLSFSIGISWNRYEQDTYINFTDYTTKQNSFAGIPLEFNFQWFDLKKVKHRILGIFPVGKPYAFGAGGGFKLQGNISNHSYVALGLVLGFGFYKHY